MPAAAEASGSASSPSSATRRPGASSSPAATGSRSSSGRAASGTLLAKLSLDRARALAAITSDDVENIAITVAALAVRSDLRVVLRAGDGDVTTEIRSLFHIGVVRDVHRIAGDMLAAAALGIDTAGAAARDGETWLVMPDGSARHFNELSTSTPIPVEPDA